MCTPARPYVETHVHARTTVNIPVHLRGSEQGMIFWPGTLDSFGTKRSWARTPSTPTEQKARSDLVGPSLWDRPGKDHTPSERGARGRLLPLAARVDGADGRPVDVHDGDPFHLRYIFTGVTDDGADITHEWGVLVRDDGDVPGVVAICL